MNSRQVLDEAARSEVAAIYASTCKEWVGPITPNVPSVSDYLAARRLLDDMAEAEDAITRRLGPSRNHRFMRWAI